MYLYRLLLKYKYNPTLIFVFKSIHTRCVEWNIIGTNRFTGFYPWLSTLNIDQNLRIYNRIFSLIPWSATQLSHVFHGKFSQIKTPPKLSFWRWMKRMCFTIKAILVNTRVVDFLFFLYSSFLVFCAILGRLPRCQMKWKMRMPDIRNVKKKRKKREKKIREKNNVYPPSTERLLAEFWSLTQG